MAGPIRVYDPRVTSTASLTSDLHDERQFWVDGHGEVGQMRALVHDAAHEVVGLHHGGRPGGGGRGLGRRGHQLSGRYTVSCYVIYETQGGKQTETNDVKNMHSVSVPDALPGSWSRSAYLKI